VSTESDYNRTDSPKLGGMMLVLLAAVIWGTTGTSQALAPPGASSMTIGALRLAVGGSALLILSLLRGGVDRGILQQPLMTVFAAAMVAAYQLCFFAAVATTGVAVGTMVAIGISPVLAGIFAFLVYGERPGRTWLLATILAVAGCILLFIPSSGAAVSVRPVGVFLAIAAGAAYVAYTMSIKGLLRTARPDSVIAVVFALGGVMLLPALIGKDLSWVAHPQGALVVLHLGLVATAFAYLLFARGLKIVPAAHAVTLSLAEPLTAALLGLIVLREPMTPFTFFGMALVFAGLVVLGISGRKSRTAAQE
jgi:DME family drug/metabolite transporter